MSTISISTTPVSGDFIYGRDHNDNLLIDHEMGGIGLNDPSQGNEYQIWTGIVQNIREIWVSAPNTPLTLVYASAYEITELSISFDQLMRPYAAFVENGQCKLYWFDSVAGAPAVLSLPAGCYNPRITLDDKRPEQNSVSDILLFYMRDKNLYYRIQRERYLMEHLLATGIEGNLLRAGMNTKYRIQFEFAIRMTEDELINGELAKGSPISGSSTVTPDNSTSPSSADIWELDRGD